MLGLVTDPRTAHQAKLSMGTVLGLAAYLGGASPDEMARIISAVWPLAKAPRV